jgi:hypothetical protein
MNSAAHDKTAHSIHSTLREHIVEHIFVGNALQWLWNRHVYDVEVLRSEFDAGGYDMVMSYKTTDRHIQFKTTLESGQAASVKASLKLLNKRSGCIIWIFVTEKLDIKHYLWLGSPEKPFSKIGNVATAKHTKGNAGGTKTERLQHRIIPKSEFLEVSSLEEVMYLLFEQLPGGQP